MDPDEYDLNEGDLEEIFIEPEINPDELDDDRLNAYVNQRIQEYVNATREGAGIPKSFTIPAGVLLKAQEANVAAKRNVYGDDLDLVPYSWKFRDKRSKNKNKRFEPLDILIPRRLAELPEKGRNLQIGAFIDRNTRAASQRRKRGLFGRPTRADLLEAYRILNPAPPEPEPDPFDNHYYGADGDQLVRDNEDAPLLTTIRGQRAPRTGRRESDESRISRLTNSPGFYARAWQRFRFFSDLVRDRVAAWADHQMLSLEGRTPIELLSGFNSAFNIYEVVGPEILDGLKNAVTDIQDVMSPYDATDIDDEVQRRHRFLTILSTIIGQGMLPLLQAMNEMGTASTVDPDLLLTDQSEEPYTVGVTPIVTTEGSSYNWVLSEEMIDLLGRSLQTDTMRAIDALLSDFLENPNATVESFMEQFNVFQELMMEDGVARAEEMGSDVPTSPLRIVGGSSYGMSGVYPTIRFGFRQRHLPEQPFYSVSRRHPDLVALSRGVYSTGRAFYNEGQYDDTGVPASFVGEFGVGSMLPDHIRRQIGIEPDMRRANRHRMKRRRKTKPVSKNRRRPRGRWAPYTCDYKGLDLTPLQIETTGSSFDNSSYPCLVYACKQTGLFTEPEIQMLMRFTGQPFVLLRSLPRIAETFNITFKIVEADGKNVRKIGTGGRLVDLCFIDGHFCLNMKHPYTAYAVENWETVYPKFGHGMVTRRNRTEVETDRGQITTLQLLNILKRKGALRPLSWTDDRALGKKFLQAWAFDDSTLEYAPAFCEEFKAVKPSPEINDARLFFGDFEACTQGDIHIPYYFSMVGANGFKREIKMLPDARNEDWESALSKAFVDGWNHQVKKVGEDEMKKGGDPAMYIYFHNLDYDCAFLLRFLGGKCDGPLITNENTVIGFSLHLGKFPVKVHIRDSYRYISTRLANFASMFNLSIEKEIFPYDYYQPETLQNLRRGKWGNVQEFVSHVPEELREELMRRLPRFLNQNNFEEVDVYGYAGYYCTRDCEVLRDGFMKFRKDLLQFTGLDTVEYFTISSLAYATLNRKGVFLNCHQLCGPPLFFIRKCVNGGRCMLARNSKVIAEGAIADFDAVSLYPSAMSKLWTVQGLPKIIPEDWTLKDLREKANDFFVEIELLRVPRHLEFPLVPHTKMTTKTYLNEPTSSLYVDNLWIDDLFEFHGVTEDDIVIKRGYYYDEGRNYTIREAIVWLFNMRLQYKMEKNSLEQVVKLLMNSCYGKSILKPVLFERRVMTDEALSRAIGTERSALLGFQQLDRCDNYLVKENVKLKKVTGFPTFGVQVLSMSKHIMSEVMVTAQENDIPIYYTDTDSMHLPEDRLPELQARFLNKYGRELIGKGMGQFHTDFSVPGKDGDWYSELFIGVGKKCYIDVLRNRKNSADKEYHIRLKGVPTEAYMEVCREHNLSPEDLMMKLYNGSSVTFDLLAGGRVSFARTKGLARTTRDTFKRCVRFLEKYPFTLDEEQQ